MRNRAGYNQRQCLFLSHLVAVDGITKRYGQRIAVAPLTLRLEAGAVFGLVGAKWGWKNNNAPYAGRHTQARSGSRANLRF